MMQGKYWKEQRRYLLRNLRDFGFGKSSMEDALQEEVQKLIDYLKPKSDKPIIINRLMNIAVLNALWYILSSEKMELGNKRIEELLSALELLLKYFKV